ncbi:MAG TPA: hypothetical protein VF530_08370 [Planctomycetota bacterium]
MLLIAVGWAGSWGLPGLRSQLLFFPLWLGYVIALDAAIERRDGSSPWTRAPRAFVGLFALSVPLWWLFEAANERLGNWEYLGREHFSDLEYGLYASLSFATVVPAVLVSAEWARGLGWIRRLGPGPRLRPSRALSLALFLLGLALLAATLRWPRVAYPGIWIAGVFLLEPLAALRGRGLGRDLARGDWRPWVALWTGGLLCGFFWELWNVHSYPKWIYHTPGVTGPKLFEMPLPGYLGYLPFALEVYLWKELWLREPELLNPPGRQDRHAPG